MTDPYVGSSPFFRVYSGKLKSGAEQPPVKTSASGSAAC